MFWFWSLATNQLPSTFHSLIIFNLILFQFFLPGPGGSQKKSFSLQKFRAESISVSSSSDSISAPLLGKNQYSRTDSSLNCRVFGFQMMQWRYRASISSLQSTIASNKYFTITRNIYSTRLDKPSDTLTVIITILGTRGTWHVSKSARGPPPAPPCPRCPRARRRDGRPHPPDLHCPRGLRSAETALRHPDSATGRRQAPSWRDAL